MSNNKYIKSLSLSEEEIERLKEITAEYKQETPPEYANYKVTAKELIITVYNSQKVVFDGKKAMELYEEFLDKDALNEHLKEYLKFPQAGSDETGKGEFIGPMCITAAYVDEEIYKEIEHLPIKDSKDINNKMKLIEIAKELESIVPHETIVLDNKRYNEIYRLENNINKVLSKAHNEAYVKLNKKIDLPKPVVIDEFVKETNYFKHLADEEEIYEDIVLKTKAEDKRISVAIAAILATYAYYNEMEKMEEKYQFKFKTDHNEINDNIKEFLTIHPVSELENVVKMHFSNYNKVIDSAKEEDIKE